MFIRKALILAALFIVFTAGIARSYEVEWIKGMDINEIAKILEMGELILLENPVPGKPPWVTACVLINAPREEVWNLITNYEVHNQFLPQVDKVTPTRKDAANVTTDIKLKFAFSILSFTVDYTCEHKLEAPFRDSFTWVKGDIKDVNGVWELHPVDGGKRTVAFIRQWSDLKSMGYLAKTLYNQQPALETATHILSTALAAKGMKEWIETPAAERGKPKPAGAVKMVEPGADPVPVYKAVDMKALLKILEKGDVTMIKPVQPGHRQYVTSANLMNAGIQHVYNTILDFDHYQEFMPQVEKVNFKGGPKEGEVEYNIKIMVGFIPLRYKYSLMNKFDPPNGMTWTMGKGDMKESSGSWELYSVKDENHTIGFYTVYADLKSMSGVVKMVLEKQPALEVSTQITTGALVVKSTKERTEATIGKTPAPAAPADKKKDKPVKEEKF